MARFRTVLEATMGIDALNGFGSLQYQKLNKTAAASDESFAEKMNEKTTPVSSSEQKEDVTLLTRYELMARVRNHIEMMQEKLENNDVEKKFQVGGMSFTEREWDKLLSNFDEQEDALRKAVEEEIEKSKEEKKYTEEEVDSIVAEWLKDKEEEV
ncbi:MAG: hypothetical protein MJ110_01240 [Lachnospiraceae bacterium]|nr:hypothetical protein [Lachnospiraceae bacterium]